MVRRIIEIDREKCNGCGACAAACHEGAIGMEDGKAVLLLLLCVHCTILKATSRLNFQRKRTFYERIFPGAPYGIAFLRHFR